MNASLTTLTMTWPADEPDPTSDHMLDHAQRRALRYVAGTPGQCTPVWGADFDVLVERGLIEVRHPGAWSRVDRYDLTPAGQSAMAMIGERG